MTAGVDIAGPLRDFQSTGFKIAALIAFSAACGFGATRFAGKSREVRRFVYGIVSFLVFIAGVSIIFGSHQHLTE